MVYSVNICLIPGLNQLPSRALEIVEKRETGPNLQEVKNWEDGAEGTSE